MLEYWNGAVVDFVMLESWVWVSCE